MCRDHLAQRVALVDEAALAREVDPFDGGMRVEEVGQPAGRALDQFAAEPDVAAPRAQDHNGLAAIGVRRSEGMQRDRYIDVTRMDIGRAHQHEPDRDEAQHDALWSRAGANSHYRRKHARTEQHEQAAKLQNRGGHVTQRIGRDEACGSRRQARSRRRRARPRG